MVNTMTESQATFLKTLQEEREVTPNAASSVELLRETYRMGMATSKMASDVITILKRLPKKTTDLTAGIYETPDRSLYRVYLGQQSGKMLAARIVQVTDDNLKSDVIYAYEGLADKVLPECRRLSREEVAERTLAYGSTSCMVCARRLDVPESVDRGIGPVCWENYT